MDLILNILSTANGFKRMLKKLTSSSQVGVENLLFVVVVAVFVVIAVVDVVVVVVRQLPRNALGPHDVTQNKLIHTRDKILIHSRRLQICQSAGVLNFTSYQ